ncbi:MAG TPA: RNA methyltransferase [Aggregatilineaceae bacterium]|nr:RNA methyltransferase [Aggregatilineaceae bacterium]
MDLISSPQNDRFKLVRLLQSQAKARRKNQQIVLEGMRLMRDALENGSTPDFVLFQEDAEAPIQEMITALQGERIKCFPVIAELMREMADTETPQGILGVFPMPNKTIPETLKLVVVADGWRDPGNLGTLIRTAAAAGVDLVALTPGTVDPYNPKTLRGGMGAQYRVAIRSMDWSQIAERLGHLAFYLADASGEVVYTDVDWTQPCAIVIGGEAHGFSRTEHQLAHQVIQIPMEAGAESLNAAVAASILIYEARRAK